jgi:hypothetical protein
MQSHIKFHAIHRTELMLKLELMELNGNGEKTFSSHLNAFEIKSGKSIKFTVVCIL